MNTDDRIKIFLNSKAYGVVGASKDRAKFGNRVLRVYLRKNLKVYPVNPKESTIEGLACLASVAELPPEVQSLSIITPPAITEKIVHEAIEHGILNIWMQPGAESPAAVQACLKAKINLIAGGPCILVELD